MRMIDMFSGMGNMRLGFEQAGCECVYSIEFDKHKREIYKAIYGEEPEGNDITEIRGTDLPRAELWAFGAPCQDFSVAGRRAGLDGSRSGLVREVFRLVREKEPDDRPEWLLYENVKGMLSSNGGWDFAAIQAEMGELGYTVQWQLLNSKDFGVPQNRERVYTLGHLRTKGERKVFPIGKNDIFSYQKNANTISTSQVVGALTSTCFKQHGDGTYIVEQIGFGETEIKQLGNITPTANRDNPSQGRVYDPTGLAPCLTKMEGGGREPLIASGIYTNVSPAFTRRPLLGLSRCIKSSNHDAGIIITEETQKGYAEAHEGNSINLSMPNSKTRRGRVGKGIANTLDCACNQATLQNTRIRRLTPRECMRLQGVPDSITDKIIQAGISDTQMYRAAGDAVTVNVVQAIAEKIKMNSMK